MTNYFAHETAYIDPDVEIAEGTKIWHFSHLQSGSRIGKYCVIGQNVNVGNNVIIGDHCKVQNNVSIYEGVILEDYVFCGPSMVFTNVLNPSCLYPQRGSEHYIHTNVGRGASLGANCTIVCGNDIGRYSLVAAGAVVTTPVKEHALVAGIPAKQIGWVSEAGRRLVFDENRRAYCPVSNKWYHLSEDGIAAIVTDSLKGKTI